jgi:hypothetical protein
MSMNPPSLGADLPPRYGEPGLPTMAADAANSDWSALADQPEDRHDDRVAAPKLLTPAVLRVLEWHRQHSMGHH